MIWRNPWMLCLLLLVLPIWWRWLDRTRRAAVRFSSVAWLVRQRPGIRIRAQGVVPVLRTLAVGLLVVCLARPQQPIRQIAVRSEGIAIQMLVDRSSSMRAMDFAVDGRAADRLTAVKKVFKEFLFGGEGLGGRPDDLVGMIAFAGYADCVSPLTSDRAFLLDALDRTQTVSLEEGPDEDGTAIGNAIALAVERFRSLDRRRELSSIGKIKSKIIILLTDGENTAGDIPPEKAAELAAAYGVRIYAVGAGTTGVAPMPVRDASGNVFMQRTRVTIDEATLARITTVTGGRYWRATDSESLREAYAEIDELERVEIEERRHYQYAELATETVRLPGMAIPPLLAVVAVLLAVEVVLSNSWLRRVP